MFTAPGVISSELRYPTETSKKKKRYVTFVCTVCGVMTEFIYVKSKFKCKCFHCSRHSMDTESFIALGIKHFGSKYDYSETAYRGKLSPVTIICPIHGRFVQRAQEHTEGHGCLKCAQEQRKETYLLPKEIWIKRMEKYPLVSFKDTGQIHNWHKKVDLICKIHGEFRAPLGSVGSSTHLCTKCAHHAHQLQSVLPQYIGRNACLYYVYLPEIDMYKFGVTLNNTYRFTQLGKGVVPLLLVTKEYTEAIRLEHKVFTTLDKYRYKGSQKLIKNGSTELFTRDVIKQVTRALQE